MKKNFQWMLAAILTCGSMFSSCTGNLDSPVQPEPPVLPDQAAMFVQNVIADGRYTPSVMVVGDEELAYLRLDVADNEEALAEFLKLLPEGVAATACEDEFHHGMFVESTGYALYAPQQNDIDSIFFMEVQPVMSTVAGIAWVELTPDLKEALHVNNIIYMQASSNDDMDNFVASLMGLMPYSKPDPEDPSHLICTVPSPEVYTDLIKEMLTNKMMSSSEYLEDGNLRMTLSDKNDNSYGKLTVLGQGNRPEDAINVFLFDEDLQTSMAAKIGGAFAKLSFYFAPVAEPTVEPVAE
jgi:hypothetical protein